MFFASSMQPKLSVLPYYCFICLLKQKTALKQAHNNVCGRNLRFPRICEGYVKNFLETKFYWSQIHASLIVRKEYILNCRSKPISNQINKYSNNPNNDFKLILNYTQITKFCTDCYFNALKSKNTCNL